MLISINYYMFLRVLYMCVLLYRLRIHVCNSGIYIFSETYFLPCEHIQFQWEPTHLEMLRWFVFGF